MEATLVSSLDRFETKSRRLDSVGELHEAAGRQHGVVIRTRSRLVIQNFVALRVGRIVDKAIRRYQLLVSTRTSAL